MKFAGWLYFCLLAFIVFPTIIAFDEAGLEEETSIHEDEKADTGEDGRGPEDEGQNIVTHSSDTYSSLKLLLIAAKNALPGSVLKLHTGTHRDTGEYEILASGITIEAKHSGKAIIKPHSAGLMIKLIGDNNRIAGLQFINGYGISDRGGLIEVTGSNNTLTNLNFYKIYVNHYINIIGGSQFNEISYCNFELKPKNKARAGTVVVIHTDPDVIGYHKVHHCSFQNMDGGGGDYGNEPLRVGMDGLDEPYISRVIIEYNVFNNTYLGDSETISIKSRENIVRYNTFGQNQGAMLSFRSGDFNVAYGNWFIGSGGVRIKEVNNIYIYNNYFQNAGSASDKTYSVDYYELEERDADLDLRNNITVYFNTFVESEYVNLDTVAKPTSQSGWFANNIFIRRKGDLFTGIGMGINFLGNLYEGTLGDEFFIDHELDVSEFNPLDSDMEMNSDGTYYVPSELSPARGNAALWPTADSMSIFDIPVLDDDPFITLDITGRLRPTIKKDVGCYQHLEFETEIINVPMTVDNVGPLYAVGGYPTMSPTMQPTYSQQPTVSPTTAYPTTRTPTEEPSVAPWFVDPPSAAPSISFAPTNPTNTPTMKPSKPTKSPTPSPSAKPSTLKPSTQPTMHPAASGAPWFRLSNKRSKVLEDESIAKGSIMEKGVPWNYDPTHAPSKKPHSPSVAPSNTGTPTVPIVPTGAPWFGTEMASKGRIEDQESTKEEKAVATADADGGHELFGHSGKVQPTEQQQEQKLPQKQPQQQSSSKETTRTDQDQGKGTTDGQETQAQRVYFESMMALKNSLIPQTTSESTSENTIQRGKKIDQELMVPWNDPTLPTSSPTGLRETGIPSSAPWFHTQTKTAKDDQDAEDSSKGTGKLTKKISSSSIQQPSEGWEKEEKESLQESKETLISLEQKLQTLQKTLKNNEKKLRGS